jgi:hypothetical protein
MNSLGDQATLTGAVTSAPAQSILAAAEARFGSLSDIERRLVQAITRGEIAAGANEGSRLEDLRGEERAAVEIRGELLAWLCSDREIRPHVTYRGVRIGGAFIVGNWISPT